MIALTRRNLTIFFRDRAAVFFSLLSALIMIALYILFLGDVYETNFTGIDRAREMLDRWVMAGLLATTSATATLGAFSSMVHDRSLQISKDFYASPISRKRLAGGYVCGALVIGMVISALTWIIMEGYMLAKGRAPLPAAAWLKILLLLLLADLSNAAMTFLIASFFTSGSAYNAAGIVFGTLLGFLTGIYLPIGFLPEAVQWGIRLFPTSHAAALLRQALMERVMSDAFSQIPAQELLEAKHMLGVSFQFGQYECGALGSILWLLASILLFFSLALLIHSRKAKQ